MEYKVVLIGTAHDPLGTLPLEKVFGFTTYMNVMVCLSLVKINSVKKRLITHSQLKVTVTDSTWC